jgi:hypothetical protein
MKPFEIEWKDKRKIIKFGVTICDKEKLTRASDDTIDLLRKKHKLSPLECAFVLDCLLESLQDTMGQLFQGEVKG